MRSSRHLVRQVASRREAIPHHHRGGAAGGMGGSVFRLPNSVPTASPWLYCLFAPVCRLAEPRNSNMAAPKSNSRTGTERMYPLMTRYIPSGTRPKVCIARRFDHDVERRSTGRRHCLWSCVARRPPGRWTMWPNPAPVNGQPFGPAGVAASTSSKFPRVVRDSSLSLLNSIPLRHQHD